MPAPLDILLLCRCRQAQLVPANALEEVRAALVRSGIELIEVDDLCELSERRHEVLARIASQGRSGVIACFERAVRCLFQSASSPLPAEVRLFNLRSRPAAEIIRELGLEGSDAHLPGPERHVAAQGDWAAWFPLIDLDRCKHCGQCLNFCLFGVYRQEIDGCIRVVKPRNCKTGCPACARVCPHGAIVFPKYKAAPINGDESAQAEPSNLDNLVRQDVYDLLRHRNAGGGADAAAGRFPTEQENQQDIQRAFQERLNCSHKDKPAPPEG